MNGLRESTKEDWGIPSEPGKLADMFGDYARSLLDSGSAQRLGNDTFPYERGLVIRERPRQGRVTYVRRIGQAISDNPFPVTHEIHFPSVDGQNGDYTVSRATFVRNHFDDAGNPTSSDRFSRASFSAEDPEVETFLEEVFDTR